MHSSASICPSRIPLQLLLLLIGAGMGGWAGQALAEPNSPGAAAPAATATLSLSAPLDWQVFQRTDASHGAIVVAGEWAVPRHAAALPERAEVRISAPGETSVAAGKWRSLPFDARARGFRGEVPTPAGGWYRVEVRLLRADAVLASTEVAHVGIGEVFLIAGQSNSANYAEERQRPETGMVTAFDGEHWAMANDPQPGATGTKGSFIPSLGDALFRRLHVPIGVACVGVGSTSVREWMPADHPMSVPPTTGAHCVVVAGDKFVSSGELFAKLAERLSHFGPRGVRAVLWHQGESDWHQPEGHNLTLPEYRADLTELIADSRKAARWDVPWFVAQASYGNPQQTGSAEFRAQQLAVADGRLTFPGPNTDTLTAEWREKNGQGVHFNAAGQKRHGEMWADIVGRWIDGP